MSAAIALLLLYVLLPFVGLYTFSPLQENIYGNALTMAPFYAIHLAIFFGIVFFSIFFKNKKKKITVFSYSSETVKRIFLRCKKVLWGCIAVMLYYGVGNIVTGDIGRGDFRITLGALGFFYNFVSMLAPAACVVLASSAYLKGIEKKELSRSLLYIYILAVLIGLLTGFKFSALLIISGGLIIISPKLNMFRIFFIVFAITILMIWSAIYFMDLDTQVAANYLLARMTSVAAEGTVGVWNIFREGSPQAGYSLFYAFGNKIASLLLSFPVNSVDFLKVNLTRYIGYLTNPNPGEALSGAFNLTVTNFGEAIYFFGDTYFFVFSIISGLIVGAVMRVFYNAISPIKNPRKIAFITTYMTCVVFPWLIGGTIASIFGLPTMINFFLLNYIIRYCMKPVNFKRTERIS